MNELLREIEEDIRRERIDKLWNSFGKMMVGASIAIVLATIVIVVVQNARQSRHEAQTSLFLKGMERLSIADNKGAIAAFSTLAEDDSSSYYGLAMLQKAQAQKDGGDVEGAKKTYQELAVHDATFGGLGKMLSNPDTVIEPNKKSPFYSSEREWQGWQLVKQGKNAEAAIIFAELRENSEITPSLRARMDVVLQHIAPEKLSDTKAAAHE